MLFAIICTDKENALDIRLANREAHLAWVQGDHLKLAGPFLSDDNETMVGSLLVVEMENLSAAQEWAAQDPYAKAGLFESVQIRPWKHVLGAIT